MMRFKIEVGTGVLDEIYLSSFRDMFAVRTLLGALNIKTVCMVIENEGKRLVLREDE
jgi:hypothetical protein